MSAMHETKLITLLLAITLLSGITLASAKASADTDSTDTVSLTVPIACTMTGEGTSHTATLDPGTYSGVTGSEYENGIGKTTLTAICNDDNGFSIYAIGYTNNQYEGENHTKLIGQSTNSTIATKAYASGDTTSNWSMKLTKITDSAESYNPQNLTIQSDTEGTFNNWHSVPDTYTKVAEYHANTGSSTTDTTLGVKLETTYAAYIASSQPADTYAGQVKYTLVHPYNHATPEPPSFEVLYTGRPLSIEPGQENPVTVLMSNLPQDGTYNLLGTEDGLYDKLTNSTLYSGYSKYNESYKPFEEYLQEYEVYDGTNIDFNQIAITQTVDAAHLSPSDGEVYIVRETPSIFLSSPIIHDVYYTSTLELSDVVIFTIIDNKIYKAVNFFVTDLSDDSTVRFSGKITKSYTFNTWDGQIIETITPQTIHSQATGGENRLLYMRHSDNSFMAKNRKLSFRPFWITPDLYTVTGNGEIVIDFADMTTTNMVITRNSITPTISR